MSQSFDNILSRPDAVNVAHIVERCHVLGPGERFIIWTQGCPLRCPGCHNPQFQPFENRLWIPVEELASMILAVKGIEGATLVGGEPFCQAQALAKLSKKLRSAGLTVMTYTGFTIEELRAGTVPYAKALLNETDLLLDGPYHIDQPTNRLWRGSDNQRLIVLTERYREKLSEWNTSEGHNFELRVSETGTIEILGILPMTLSSG